MSFCVLLLCPMGVAKVCPRRSFLSSLRKEAAMLFDEVTSHCPCSSHKHSSSTTIWVWYVPPQTSHHPFSRTPLELCQLEYPYQMQPLEFKTESWVQIPLLPLPTKSADAYAHSIHDTMVEDPVEAASIKIAPNGNLRSSQDDLRGKCVVLLFTEGTRSE